MGSKIHIVADENIGLVEDFFAPFGTITLLGGTAIKPADLRNTDALLIRSVTKVNSYLLSACTDLKFIGSATSGTDHVDIPLLDARGIHFAYAPGSNAQSVAEYVLAAVISRYKSVDNVSGLTVGVVGVGKIGSRVARMFKALGCSVIANDPPLFEGAGRPDEYEITDLDTLLTSSDVISLHVPLTRSGSWPTSGFIDTAEAVRIRNGSLFINTSRGEVVTQRAIRQLQQSSVNCVLDVWPGEPSPHQSIVEAAFLATPHIAGYSFDGKIRGTRMLRDALCDFLPGREPTYEWDSRKSAPELRPDPTSSDEFASVIRAMYSIVDDDRRFKDAYLASPESERGRVFAQLRKDYPRRRSFDAYQDQWEKLSETTRHQLSEIVGLLVAE